MCATLALAPLLAQGPSPSAVLQGRLRSFSPKGRFAVVQDGSKLKVYDTASWKASEGLEAQGAAWETFGAILVDDEARVAAARAEELQVFDFSGVPRHLATIPNSQTFLAIPHQAEQGLLVKVISVPPKPTGVRLVRYTRIFFVVKTELSTLAHKYDIVPFSVHLRDLVEARTRGGGQGVPTAAEVEALRKAAIPGFQEKSLGTNEAPSDQGSPGTVLLKQLRDDHFRVETRGMYLWVHARKPGSAEDRLDWVWRDGTGNLNIEATAARVSFPLMDGSKAPSQFSLRDGVLLCGAGRVLPGGPDALPDFPLRVKPAKVSADGRWLGAEPVATDGGSWTTAVFASETVTDPFAGYAPEVLQDLLLGKIIAFIKGNKPGLALPYFRRLERTGEAQPQSFYYYRMKALEEVGRKQEARAEAEAYLKRHGKQGEFYGEVIALLNRMG